MDHFLCTVYINCRIFSDQRHHAISFLQQHVFVKRKNVFDTVLNSQKHRFVKRSNHTRSPHTIVKILGYLLSLVDRVTRCAGARLRFSLGACVEYTFLPSTQIKRTSPRSTCAIYFCSISGVSKFLKKAWCCVGGSRVDNVN